MTETEWLNSTDPQAILDWLHQQGKLSERKARLVAVACCRRIWPLLTDERSRKGVEVAELYGDGSVDEEGIELAGEDAYRASEFPLARSHLALRNAAWAASAAAQAPTTPFEVADETSFHACDAVKANGGEPGRELASQAYLVRDIYGPLPFRPVTLPPSIRTWNDGCVVKLATAIYEERTLPAGTFDNDRMGVLADALEEAGCTDQDLLGHCRQPGAVHVRGCFVVDLLLGKK